MFEKIAYIAGPYRAETDWQRQRNILAAREVALVYWKLGYGVICPHANTANFDGELADEAWLGGYSEILSRCDLIVLIPGWRDSAGARAEATRAFELGIPIEYYGEVFNSETLRLAL
jgi:hypothetical protein